jgi:glycosyltransferase involved in cell wall biosynthesis
VHGGKASTYTIAANGLLSDGPAQALRDHLVGRGARVVTVFHPLTSHEGTRHLITTYAGGARIEERTIHLPLRPPFSYAFDPFVPLASQPTNTWFGFNPLACARGLAARRRGRARSVVLWSVDFVPQRFGPGPLTRIYDRVDRFCCLHADARVELSEAARDARSLRHRLPPTAAPAHVVPMGSWLDRVPTTSPDAFKRRRIVFLGHLVEGKGVEILLEALALLTARGEAFTADIIGTGPLEASLRERAVALELGRPVRFHGFVADHRDVESLLSESSTAVAPYSPDDLTYTRYADPGKLKAYLAAGLPIVLTGVPPNADELTREAGAEIAEYDAAAIADAISRSFASGEQWEVRRRAALAYARRFDWNVLLPDILEKLEHEDHEAARSATRPRTNP